MSSYCTATDVSGEIQASDLIFLTDDAPCMGVINQTILAQVITNASGEIDRMVGNRYSTPFNPVPPSVQSMALVITCYRLYRRRLTPDETNLYYKDYKDISEFLAKVKTGDEELDLTVQTAFEQVQYSGRPTVYGGAYGGGLSNSF